MKNKTYTICEIKKIAEESAEGQGELIQERGYRKGINAKSYNSGWEDGYFRCMIDLFHKGIIKID